MVDMHVSLLKKLKKQMERATEENKEVLMMADRNMCTNKWNNPQYKHHRVAAELKSGMKQNGVLIVYLGNTYLADNITQSGNIEESALDHIYITRELEERVKVFNFEFSATDHLPIIAEITRREVNNRKEKSL